MDIKPSFLRMKDLFRIDQVSCRKPGTEMTQCYDS